MGLFDSFKDSVEIVNQPLDKWGEPDGAPTITTEKARIDYSSKVITNAQGINVRSSALVFLRPNTVATANSILRFEGKDNTILTYEKISNLTKIHHIEIYVA